MAPADDPPSDAPDSDVADAEDVLEAEPDFLEATSLLPEPSFLPESLAGAASTKGASTRRCTREDLINMAEVNYEALWKSIVSFLGENKMPCNMLLRLKNRKKDVGEDGTDDVVDDEMVFIKQSTASII